jgi:hypothetical protein
MSGLFGGGAKKPSLAQRTQEFYLQQQDAAKQGQAQATAAAQAELSKAGATQQPPSLKQELLGDELLRKNAAGGFFGAIAPRGTFLGGTSGGQLG